MAGPNNKFIKKQKTEKRLKKRKEKLEKKKMRRENPKETSFENMIAYVDKFGNITDEPPGEGIAGQKEVNSGTEKLRD